MPLILEVFAVEKGWVKFGEVGPNDRPGSISNNTAEGVREIYLFSCSNDDRTSTIYRSGFGVDQDITPDIRAVTPELSLLEPVAELQQGETYELQVNPDHSPHTRRIRFRHT